VRPNKRIFNNAKVSDHFAITPTSQLPKGLSEPEQKIYEHGDQAVPGDILSRRRVSGNRAHHPVEGEPFRAGKSW